MKSIDYENFQTQRRDIVAIKKASVLAVKTEFQKSLRQENFQ